jgi:hypothetical protein
MMKPHTAQREIAQTWNLLLWDAGTYSCNEIGKY